MKYFEAYSIGLLYASVCSNLSLEEVVEEMNALNPTGISSPWQFAQETFADGSPNPSPCPDRKDCKHYLLKC